MCERCLELEETVRQLKDMLRGGTKKFPAEWKLSPSETIVLEHLTARGRITYESVAILLWDHDAPDTAPDIVRRHVLHIRRKVDGLDIETRWGQGYTISNETQQHLERMRS